MKSIITLVICVSFFVSRVTGAETDARPIKKIVQAKDGLKLVCEVRGKGETALVFLHGWCGDREFWKNQVDVFAPDYRVVTLDQAGHSESGKNRERWTVSGLAEDVESVVKELGLRRVILVGHSMGGPIALMSAKRMPNVVIAVIGVDTLQDAEFKMPEEISKQLLQDFTEDFKGGLEKSLPGMLNEKADPELKNWIEKKAQAQDQKMAVALISDLFGLDTVAILKEVKVPVRCINSGGGFQFFRPTAVDINSKYADYKAVLIDNVGHYPMLEKPAEFNQKLRDALKEFATKK